MGIRIDNKNNKENKKRIRIKEKKMGRAKWKGPYVDRNVREALEKIKKTKSEEELKRKLEEDKD